MRKPGLQASTYAIWPDNSAYRFVAISSSSLIIAWLMVSRVIDAFAGPKRRDTVSI